MAPKGGTSACLATPHAERLYSDVVSLYTMSNDPKIKSSSWTAKQQCCLTVKLSYGLMVGRGGLEPPTSRLSGVRSNHLSYRPIKVRNPRGLRMVERIGIEPMTPCLQSRCSPS
mgnify:CR=1 FL=1